jgi:hypothetical protein
MLTLFHGYDEGGDRAACVFYDPSGTLAKAQQPLNAWLDGIDATPKN